MILLKYHIPFVIHRFILVILIIPSCLCAQEYYITESYLIKDISCCDIDLDGDADLIVCSSSNGLPDSLFIFYNDGSGNLKKSSISRRNGIFVQCGIIDNDELPDIITKDGNSILFIKNFGDGTFSEEIALAPTEGNRVIEYIADMDGDALNDLVYTYNAYYRKWGILKNHGELIFSDHIIYDNGMGGSLFPKIGMLNYDNLPDVCLSFTDFGTHVLINNGNLNFDTTLICSTIVNNAYPCKLNSISPDDIELFSINTGELFLFENIGNSEFINKDTLALNGPIILTNVTDFNNDGFDDYCYALCWWTGCTDSIYISINDQQWSFLQPQKYYVGPLELFRTESADLNRDNFNDIIIYGYSPRNAFKILWNDGFGSFSYENPVRIIEPINSEYFLKIIPNPFTNKTKINYHLDNEATVQIKIFNNLGQLVETITETGKSKGSHSYDFDASELNTGIYFCTLIVNGKSAASIKMMVL